MLSLSVSTPRSHIEHAKPQIIRAAEEPILLSFQVCYPKRTDKPLYHGLVRQLESLSIPFVEADDLLLGTSLRGNFDLVVDAIFGFSFKGAPRPPFDRILEILKPCSNPPTLVAVDSPSG